MKKKSHKEHHADVIREAGFRATKTRMLVYALLAQSKFPVSAKEVVKEIGKENIDQVTAYRILHAFQKAGVVTKVDLHRGHAQFELKDDKDDHHHHVICTKCERIEDFTGCESQHLVTKAMKQASSFAQIHSHSLEFFGLCTSCAGRGRKI